MNKVRINSDIFFAWKITTNGEGLALEGRNLTLYITDRYGNKTILPYTIADTNTVVASFWGKDQKKLGRYTLTLGENVGFEGSRLVDAVDAVELVPLSCMAAPDKTCHNLAVTTIDLEGNLDSGGRGASAYEVWLLLGYTGSEADFIASLKGEKGDKGDKGDQGDPASVTFEAVRLALGFTPDNPDTVVHKAGAEEINGKKTFTSQPIVPVPTSRTAAANKQYVDELLAQYVKRTGDQSINGVKTFLADVVAKNNLFLGGINGCRVAPEGHGYERLAYLRVEGVEDFYTIMVERDPVVDMEVATKGYADRTIDEILAGDKQFHFVVLKDTNDTDETVTIKLYVDDDYRKVLVMDGNPILRGASDPVLDEDLATKRYVDQHSGGVEIIDDTYTKRADAALSANQGALLGDSIRYIEGEYEMVIAPTIDGLKRSEGKVKQIFSENDNFYPLLIANNSGMVDSHLTTLGASYYSDQILFNPATGQLKVGGLLVATNVQINQVSSVVSALSSQVTNLATENTEQDGRLTALEQRPIVDKDLTERVTDLENDRKYNHNLGNTRIKSLSVDEPIKVCDAPMVLIGSGAPSATNVPQNWDKETMGEWFGIPNFIGQMYVNISASSNALYVAVNDTAVSGWKTA